MISLVIFLLLSVFITVLFAGVGLILHRKTREYEKRLTNYTGEVKKEKSNKETQEKKWQKLLFIYGNKLDQKLKLPKLTLLLKQAGAPYNAGLFVLIQIIIGSGAGLLFYAVLNNLLVTILVGFLFGYFPFIILKRKKKRRLHLASQQLTEAIGMLSNAMRAGFSFIQAMKIVAEETPAPLGKELLKTNEDLNLGISMEEAFRRLNERLPSRDLELVTNALLTQKSSGGNMTELLDIMQDTMIGRVQVKDEIRTLTAQGRMSKWVLTAVPIGLFLYLQVVNREFMEPLFTHPLGWFMIGYALIGTLIAWIILGKIVEIEV